MIKIVLTMMMFALFSFGQVWAMGSALPPLPNALDLQPVMVKDINTTQDQVSVKVGGYTKAGGITFFTADDGVHGKELWKSDGTALGTAMVKDIIPGAVGSNPSDLTNVGGVLFFYVVTDELHQALWKSDGTEVGTVLVKDEAFFGSVNAGGSVYFLVMDITASPIHPALWKSDGAAAGTVMVKELNIDLYLGKKAGISSLINVGGTIYFFTDDGTDKSLWKSDGTADGTVVVTHGVYPDDSVAVVNNRFYFTNDDGTNGMELWTSDGTSAGTKMVMDLNPGASSSYPEKLTKVGDFLYFMADDGYIGERRLWKTDGTEAGTVWLSDVDPVSNFTDVGGVLYFTFMNNELWKSDGTPGGTGTVKRITNGSGDSNPENLTAVGGVLYFTANGGTNGNELWKSDGTAAGTVLVKDINPGSDNSNPVNLTDAGGVLYFTANDGVNGNQFWTSDGTDAGTAMVKKIFVGNASSIDPLNYQGVNINGILYYTANDGAIGTQLWKSDGTVAGTALVKDISPGTVNIIQNMTNVSGRLYFTVGNSLWNSDGTEAGTVPVMDNIYPFSLTSSGGVLYFSAEDVNGRQLWKSDGTGTAMVKRIALSGSSSPHNLTDVNGTLYFFADDGTNGDSLWTSNGTAAGTNIVAPGISSNKAIAFINRLYFNYNDGTNGEELWSSDGTLAGTVMVKDINTVPGGSSSPEQLTNINGVIFFYANDGVYGRELWKSDGTETGTMLVKDITIGASGSNKTGYLTNMNGVLYFLVEAATKGRDLWKSDGTDAGTVLVKASNMFDFTQPMFSFRNVQPVSVNSRLYLLANDPSGIDKLWVSDGTAAGTQLVKSIYTGSDDGSGTNYDASNLTAVDNKLFFSADDGLHGREIWVLKQTDTTVGVDYSVNGRFVTLTATVTAGATGPVNFTEGRTPYCLAVQLDGNGKAVCIASMSAGPHTITTSYSGDGNYIGYSQGTDITVAPYSTAITPSDFTANWSAITDATGYFLDVASDSGFTNILASYNNLSVGTVTSYHVTGLTTGTPYYYRVRATLSTGGTSDNSAVVSMTSGFIRTVTTKNDSGAGSLRQAILDGDYGDEIRFAATVTGAITLATPLVIDKDLMITGPGVSKLTISGGGASQIFVQNSGAIFTMTDLTLANGKAVDGNGGALMVQGSARVKIVAKTLSKLTSKVIPTATTITRCVFSNNAISSSEISGGFGGAIYAGSGTMTISDTLFSGNSTDFVGGAIYNEANVMYLTNVTMSGNSSGKFAGGIASDGELHIVNSTITGNSATKGGGIVLGSSSIDIVSSTISLNNAEDGGGIIVLNPDPVTLTNSIIANNAATTGPDINGSVISNGYNLIGTTDGATITGDTTGNIIGSDPLLGALVDNGGPTKTMALRSGSPAINAGTCTDVPLIDQRGMSRPQNGACDIGAFERGTAILTVTGGNPLATFVNEAFGKPLVVKAADSLGAALDGVTVTFAGPGSGEGITSGGSVNTSSTGIASYNATANGTAGNYVVTATDGSSTVTFNMSNLIFYPPVYIAQSIGVITLLPATLAVSGTTTVQATASSGLGVSFTSITPTVCSVKGATVTGVKAGTCSLVANQGGNTIYSAASQVRQNFNVDKANQAIGAISFTPLTVAVKGTTTAVAKASSALAVTFSSATPDVCTVNGSIVTGITAGTCAIIANQGGNADFNSAGQVTQNITVTKASQSIGAISFTPLTVKVNGTTSAAATASSALAVTFSSTTPDVCTVNGTTVTGVTPGTCTVAANQGGNAGYGPAVQVTRNITVTKADQSISAISFSPQIVAVTGATTVTATATSALEVKFSSTTPAICSVNGTTVTGTAAGTCTIAADQSGNAVYNAAPQVKQNITISDITPPTMSMSVSTLADNATTGNATLNVSGTASDSESGVRSVTVNGHAAYVRNGSFSTAVTLVDGVNTITTIATDNADNKTTDIRTINLDRTAPGLTIFLPTDNSVTNKTFVDITGSVDDSAATVTAKVTGASAASATMSGTNFSVTQNLTSGLNTIDITVTDQAGNSASAKRTITSDATAPALAVTEPAQDMSTKLDSITISGTVSDNFAGVTASLTVDNQTFALTIAADGSFSQAITMATEKTYAVVVTAADQAGNNVTVQRNIIKSSLTPSGDINGDGKVDIADALKVMRIAAGLDTASADNFAMADVAPLKEGKPAPDGIIDIADAVVIMQKSVGLRNW